MISKVVRLAASMACAVILLPEISRATLVSFDSVEDIAEFNLSAFVEHRPTSGVGDSGAIEPAARANTTTHSALSWVKRPFRFNSPGDVVSTSIIFKFGVVNDFNFGRYVFNAVSLRLHAEPQAANTSQSELNVQFQLTQFGSDAPVERRLVVFRELGPDGFGFGEWDVPPLVDGHWYRLSADFRYLAGEAENRVNVSLDHFGLDGMQLVSNVLAQSATHTDSNLGFLSDDAAWVGFKVNRTENNGGARLVDQFIVIPEPATSAMILGVMSSIPVLRRRALVCGPPLAPPSSPARMRG